MLAERDTVDLNPALSARPLTERVLAAFGMVGIAIGSVLVAAFDPAKSTLFPICPLFAATGFACPGCGLTRAFHALFNGDVIPALDFNFLVPVWAAILTWVFVSLSLLAVRGRGLWMWPATPRFLWTFMIVLVGFGVLRNIPVWPLT